MTRGSTSIGVIMLDTRFPRFTGDIGNPDTWPFDVVFKVVNGACAKRVVCATASQEVQPFIDAALDLQASGVSGITTSCGFLSLVQREITRHLDVPFIASSLVQLPWVQATLPEGKQAGVLTIDATALSKQHLLAAGIQHPVPIGGVENGCEFHQCIMADTPEMNQVRCQQDNTDAAIALVNDNPNLGALILECTNMAPYASAIHRATGLPVYSIYTLIRWLQAGLSPKSFEPQA